MKQKAGKCEHHVPDVPSKKRRIETPVDRFKALLGGIHKNSVACSGEHHREIIESDPVRRKLKNSIIKKFYSEGLDSKLSNEHWEGFIARILQVIDRMRARRWIASEVSENYKEIPQLLVSGPPQSGKTLWIALLGITAKQKKICTFVVTTTTDLCCKMCDDLNHLYFSRFDEADRPTCVYIGCNEVQDSMSTQAVKRCLLTYGVIVINFHAMSIKHLLNVVRELRGYSNSCKFVLVKDQSDVLHHETDTDRHLHLARLEGRRLLEHGYFGCPLLTLNVTSRPLPVLLRLHDTEQHRVLATDDWHLHAPGPGYVGLDRMEPLLDRVLRDGELTRRNGYWSDGVEALYADAHPDRPCAQRPGALLVDGASPLVCTPDSIRRRAEAVQARFPRFAAVLLWGAGGCAVRYPGAGGWVEGDRLARLVAQCFALRRAGGAAARDSSLLDLLLQEEAAGPPAPAHDRPGGEGGAGPPRARGAGPSPPVTAARLLACVDPPPGSQALPAALRRPLVVMGRSRLRGEGLASAVRAPTHVVCPGRPSTAGSALGWGMSYGEALLRRDGRGSVRVLATGADWAAAADAARQAEALRIAMPGHGAPSPPPRAAGGGREEPAAAAAAAAAAALARASEPQRGPVGAGRAEGACVDLTGCEEAGPPPEPARGPSQPVSQGSGGAVLVDLTRDEPPASREPLVVDLSGGAD